MREGWEQESSTTPSEAVIVIVVQRFIVVRVLVCALVVTLALVLVCVPVKTSVVVIVVLVLEAPKKMRKSITNGACWFCAMLDVLCALTLTPTLLYSAQLQDRLLSQHRWEERRRHVRALQPPNGRMIKRPFPVSNNDMSLKSDMSAEDQDLRDTKTLQVLDIMMNTPLDNCTIRGYITFEKRMDSGQFQKAYQGQVQKAVQIANLLNSLFLYNWRSADLYKNVTYFALTHSLVQSDPKVKGCGIVFKKGQYLPISGNSASSFYPYSYRTASGTTIVSDLSSFYNPLGTSWFHNQSVKDPSKFALLEETIFTNSSDVGSYSTYETRWNKTAHVSGEDGFWSDAYYDCLLQAWILQFSLPFFETHSNGTAAFKGVVLLEFDLGNLKVNQCDQETSDGALFTGTHRCDKESTTCLYIPGRALSWGSYQCVCRPGFFFPDRNATNRSFFGRDVELAFLDMMHNRSLANAQDYRCVPCREGCDSCEGDEPCVVQFDVLLRSVILGVQCFTINIVLLIGIVIAGLRKTKVMRSSVWVLLEMIILGALFLYATVIIQYFEPTATNCMLVPWFREVGFALLYGTLVLKIYRILAEFQSRKAHRVHVRDRDLFKSLAVILVVVVGYMAAWTAVNVDQLAEGTRLIQSAKTEDNLAYVLCKSLWWEYVIESAEVLFLGVGLYLSYCVRAAPSDYSEGRYITVAMGYELGFSTIFYVLKHMWWLKLHPDHLFLMYMLRCQLTVTVNLIVLLGPKLWYAYKPPDDDRIRTRAYSSSDVQDSTAPETMKLNVGISSNGDVDVGEISLTDMDPEEIRAELKRLYTQLQVYRTKTMRKDNPHISKRRGGRKQTHRRFSLQAFHHKHRSHHEHEHEHEMSKTPEESTNSAEAVPFPIEPSVKEEPNEGSGSIGGSGGSWGRNPPSVSFKPGHV